MRIRRPEDIAAAVREARRKAGLTQVELASRLEVNREWVYRLENGEPGVSLGMVLRALNVLGVHLRIEMGEEEAKAPGAGKRTTPRISIDEIVDD